MSTREIRRYFYHKLLFIICFFEHRGHHMLMYVLALLAGFAGLAAMTLWANSAHASNPRIKDVVMVEGVRENMLVGYGLVMGLNGTGDKLNNSIFTEKSLQAFLSRVGVNASDKTLKVKNVAAVTVTAVLPPFARNGSRVDVTVSALGDAKSLQGGTLLATPLLGADGNVYAVAQGAVSISGFEAAGSSGSSVTKNTPTGGFVASGAIVEREVAFELNELHRMNLSLRNPDITTATSLADTINNTLSMEFGKDVAMVRDPGTVTLDVPTDSTENAASVLAKIENLTITTDQPARILIDEASGTIVMNQNVKIDTVAVAQGNLVVKVNENPTVTPPLPLTATGTTATQQPNSTVKVEEGYGKKMTVLDSNPTLQDLVNGLNALGVGPRDMIGILQNIKAAGALHAEIETR